MAEQFNEEEEMNINQEYKIWKKEASSLYDFLVLHSVDWPSYNFQWLPETEAHSDETYHYAIISSNTADSDQSQVMKVQISIPNESKCEQYMQNKSHKLQIIQKMPHNGEINRVRYCPANSKIMAVATSKGDITLTSMKESLGKLVSHTAEGYGLSWNQINGQLLASGNTDKRICIWDIQKNKQENQKILPFFEIIHHNAPIEDVAWHKHHSNIFASCSDDRLIMVWDMRFRTSIASDDKKPLFQIVAHTDQVYSLDFSPFNEFLFASGSRDESVSVWDMRNLTRSLTTFNGEKNSVMKVQWSPFNAAILASCGYGRNVDIWDLSKEIKDQETGLLFRHQGHRSRVLDFDWNSNEKLLIGSVEESNCVHVWEMTKSAYYDDDQTK